MPEPDFCTRATARTGAIQAGMLTPIDAEQAAAKHASKWLFSTYWKWLSSLRREGRDDG